MSYFRCPLLCFHRHLSLAAGGKQLKNERCAVRWGRKATDAPFPSACWELGGMSYDVAGGQSPAPASGELSRASLPPPGPRQTEDARRAGRDPGPPFAQCSALPPARGPVAGRSASRLAPTAMHCVRPLLPLPVVETTSLGENNTLTPGAAPPLPTRGSGRSVPDGMVWLAEVLCRRDEN